MAQLNLRSNHAFQIGFNKNQSWNFIYTFVKDHMSFRTFQRCIAKLHQLGYIKSDYQGKGQFDKNKGHFVAKCKLKQITFKTFKLLNIERVLRSESARKLKSIQHLFKRNVKPTAVAACQSIAQRLAALRQKLK